jgi:hypothetical protein
MNDVPDKVLTPDELRAVIDRAAREGWTELDLSNRGITELPSEIGRLTNLKTLKLGNIILLTSGSPRNRLKTLPDAVAYLTNLQVLDLMSNQLATLPSAVTQLTNLRVLDLSRNQIAKLPKAVAHLTDLHWLDLSRNQMTTLPNAVAHLANLQTLDLSRNQITKLPDAIAHLTNLEFLGISYNQLKTLPDAIASLTNLQYINLANNPLNHILQSVYDAGLAELRAYLKSLEEAEQLHEAKLILVGEGGVGKTTLRKALAAREGEEPHKGEATTHGIQIDIDALHIRHPHQPETTIRLNAWDFGGQEVYRITHQFFFSRRALYLLVWEPRRGVQQCQVEDWLNLIRLRVGDDARVLIVSTHCRTGGRIARIDKPVLLRDYPTLIAGFYEVDSLVDDPTTGEKCGIAALKAAIAEEALGLAQMGIDLGRSWLRARDALLARPEPHIPYARLEAICADHGLSAVAASALAHLMHDLGYILYYAEDERLRDDVVLQPEWMTKAIGFVLEDPTTQEMEGILPDRRLVEVWRDHQWEDEPRYDPALYPFFLRLMERYDVCYRLPDGKASLIAQHVPQVRPKLPWLADEAPADDRKRIAMICSMDEDPPGLVPWMIVRTHDYATEREGSDGHAHRLHWQRGMFLTHPPHGEALLEKRGREFHIYTQADWPIYFNDVLQNTLQNLITDNWPGLKGRYRFTVPCPAIVDAQPCAGRFDIDALRQFLAEGDRTIRCQVCRQRQSIAELLLGFEERPVDAALRELRDQIEARSSELESRLAYYVMGIMRAIADEAKEGPRLFTLVDAPQGGIREAVSQRYRIHLWCEAEEGPHPVSRDGPGVYAFSRPRTWVRKVAPYANFALGVLKTALPLVAPVVDAAAGKNTVKDWDYVHHLDLAEATVKALPEEIAPDAHLESRPGILSEPERSGLLMLHALLRDLDPNQEKLGLRRVPTYTGDYRWLCDTHYEAWRSKIPDKIEVD